MKKAGILTYHSENNFGAVLQSYALCEFIQKLDIQAEIIDYRNPFCKKYNNEYLKHCCCRSNELFKSKLNFDLFRKKYLTLSKHIYCLDEKSIPKYDYYIIGSDIVWNTSYKKEEEYFFPFHIKDGIKIAYAPSIGVGTDNPMLDKTSFEKYIHDFDFISVRENSCRDFMQQYTKKEVHTVIDPTLLLEENDYTPLISNKRNSDKYILYYVFDYVPNALHFAQKITKRYNCKIIYYSCTSNKNKLYCYDDISFFYKSPKDFLWYVKNAEMVITNSYHSTIFSIIFKKPFYAFLRTETGSRVQSLCNILGLDDRILSNNPNLSDINFHIDYDEVYKKLKNEKLKSVSFLKEALGISEPAEDII